MNLSNDFELWEFERSQTAARMGIQNKAGPDEIDNLITLCTEVLQPVRDEIGRININSGFRCLRLNRALGSSDRSHHVRGMAADIESFDISNLELARHIRDSGLRFTQLILECYREGDPRSGWVHVSYDPEDLRMEVLTYTKKQYLVGLP